MFTALKQRLTKKVSYQPVPQITQPAWQVALKKKQMPLLAQQLLAWQPVDRYPGWLAVAALPQKTLRSWFNDFPEAAIALAVQHFAKAMQVRGDGFPEQVPEKVWPRFFDLIDAAQNWLEQCQPDPEHPFYSDWHSWMMLSQLTHAEGVHAMYAHRVQAAQQCRDNFIADHHYFLAMTRRFGGDNEQMFKFTRHVLAPKEGDGQHSLMAFAYNELAATLIVDKGRQSARKYMHRPVFVDELSQSLLAWQGGAHVSVQALSERAASPVAGWQLNEYAVALAQIGERELLPKVLAAIDGQVIGMSWQRLAPENKPPAKYYQALVKANA